MVKIGALSRKIDIDEYRDFASRKSISLMVPSRDHSLHAFVRAASCMFTQSLPLFIALLAGIESGIISVSLDFDAAHGNDLCLFMTISVSHSKYI